jgi:hypothetical protein
MAPAYERHGGNSHGDQRTASIAVTRTTTPPAGTPAAGMSMEAIRGGEVRKDGIAPAAGLGPATGAFITSRLMVAM